jgi:DNA ligase-1
MDVWFDPIMVWEVKAADLSLSPTHLCAENVLDQGKGIALRFPRFLRVRDDKTVQDTTSPEQMVEMYSSQVNAYQTTGSN